MSTFRKKYVCDNESIKRMYKSMKVMKVMKDNESNDILILYYNKYVSISGYN